MIVLLPGFGAEAYNLLRRSVDWKMGKIHPELECMTLYFATGRLSTAFEQEMRPALDTVPLPAL